MRGTRAREEGPFTVRDMVPGDLSAVVGVEQASFDLPWTSEMIGDELTQEWGYAVVAQDRQAQVVGFLLGRRFPGTWHVLDVAVAPSRRRRGAATALMKGFLAEADDAGREVLLEVREGNEEALELYLGLGFERVGSRPRYYPGGGEDALVMIRPPEGRAEEKGLQEPLAGPLLAIESSCDDTAAAVLTRLGEVRASLSHSQDAIHARYGGVVPEVASRAHVERMTAVVSETLRQAGCEIGELGGVAATVGPGLIGALLVGVQTAKAVAWARRLPLFPVNHIHGHLAAVWLCDSKAPFPMVTLVASGGHTMLVRVDDHRTFQLLGQTLDDAAGEAFDKGARLLGLGYPGGRELDELAGKGDPQAFRFPVALKGRVRPDFSFSGVKTALYYLLRDMSEEQRVARAADVAASYREAIVTALVERTLRTAGREGVKTVAVAGGVAANSLLRRRLTKEGEEAGLHVAIPAVHYCTDNAAMIGAAAFAGPRIDYPHYLGVDASASLPLGQWMPG